MRQKQVGYLRFVGTLLPACILAAHPLAQSQPPKPTFEVASVKKLPELILPSGSPTRAADSGMRFRRLNVTVDSLVRFAFNLRNFQVIGGPDWMRSDRFEVDAKAATEASPEQMRQMVQSLLEDRFSLVARKERRDMRVFTLTVARKDGRLGPKLARCDLDNPPAPRLVAEPRGGRVAFQGCGPISSLANVATGLLGAVVLDKTGLNGGWGYEVAYAAENAAERVVPDPNVVPFPTALEEQLGLKLESGRGPVDVLVIDSVQQPTEN